jgi:hypothetical protein
MALIMYVCEMDQSEYKARTDLTWEERGPHGPLKVFEQMTKKQIGKLLLVFAINSKSIFPRINDEGKINRTVECTVSGWVADVETDDDLEHLQAQISGRGKKKKEERRRGCQPRLLLGPRTARTTAPRGDTTVLAKEV